jgi:hypothetical protein
MSESRGTYFSTLKAAFTALGTHSDPFIASSFNRYGATLSLLDLKSRGDAAPKIDGETGLPVRADLQRLQADVSGASPPVSRPAAAIADDFLDIMLRRKQMPSALEIELMARALYCEQVLSLRESGEKNSIVGVAVDATMTKIFEDAREQHYGWDYFHPNESASKTYFARFMTSPSAVRQGNDQILINLSKIVGNALSASPTLLQVAAQIDEALQALRLKLVKRLELKKLHSALFEAGDSDFSPSFALISDPDEAWALEFEVTGLKSVGTVSKVSNGLLSSSSTMVEQFFVDDRDPLCLEQGASFVERHLLVPHRAYLALQGTKVLEGRQVHVLSNRLLAENV